ncbi:MULTISPECIES: cyclic nucleotide-binding/CBS domain-containing protein [unclassified Streptomyces]|uniref:CBS domain-containing protein n=1 Tax=unclassified Streptomyces TaxID=2593676 RepID=UPI00224E75B4|nr:MULTISPECIES: CBS domain-containing protein [unclassified Streptomyces]MCX4404565.1 CBS domain-containing protein [Streptomyces sp. NBC_01764]MCX5190895.1 CBS domain-containing protein [Streptomyces sp. NBC_00268]
MKVSEVMTALPVCVAPHVSLLEVTRRMTERAVGSVLVVEDDALLGIVTDRDLALRGMGGGLAPEAPVDAVMSAQVVTVDADDDLQVAYLTFRRTGVRRLPVLDGGRVVGVLAVDDLFLDVFRRLADLLGPVTWSVLHEPPGPPAACGGTYEP